MISAIFFMMRGNEPSQAIVNCKLKKWQIEERRSQQFQFLFYNFSICWLRHDSASTITVAFVRVMRMISSWRNGPAWWEQNANSTKRGIWRRGWDGCGEAVAEPAMEDTWKSWPEVTWMRFVSVSPTLTEPRLRLPA